MAPPTRKEKDLKGEVEVLQGFLDTMREENDKLSAGMKQLQTEIQSLVKGKDILAEQLGQKDRQLRKVLSAVASDAVLRTLGVATQQSGADYLVKAIEVAVQSLGTGDEIVEPGNLTGSTGMGTFKVS